MPGLAGGVGLEAGGGAEKVRSSELSGGDPAINEIARHVTNKTGFIPVEIPPAGLGVQIVR